MRAKVAADPKHDRHIMSQTACQRRQTKSALDDAIARAANP
jgi:hypothetical protein